MAWKTGFRVCYFFFIYNFILFIYLFLALLSLHCCVGLSLVALSRGWLSSCRVWASHCSGFPSFGPQALGSACFSSCGTWAQWERLPGSSESHSVMPDSLQPHGLYSPLNSPGQNTRVGSLSLLQGIFPTQGLNPGLLHCQWILYQLSPKGSPRILEWVAWPFSSQSSRPRNQTRVSCIAGRFFTNWAIREVQSLEHRLNSCGSPGA